MSQENVKDKRKAPFSNYEDEELLTEYFKRRKTLESKHTKEVTNNMKQKEWEEISAAVNAKDDRCVREVKEIKNRYNTMMFKYKTYQIELKNSKTGSTAKKYDYFDILDKELAADIRINENETGFPSESQMSTSASIDNSIPNESHASTSAKNDNSFESQASISVNNFFSHINEDMSVNQHPVNDFSQFLDSSKRSSTKKMIEDDCELRRQIQEKQFSVLQLQEKHYEHKHRVLHLQEVHLNLKIRQRTKEMNLSEDELRNILQY